MKAGAVIEIAARDPNQLRVSPAESRAPLSDCVRDALRDYLKNMGGHAVTDLHHLVMTEVERPLIVTVLEYSRGNQTRAAQLLGISRSTLRKKIAEYALDSQR